MGEAISPADIEACHCVPTQSTYTKNIIVQFKNRKPRYRVIEKARKQRLTNASLSLVPGTSQAEDAPVTDDHPMLVSEQLCPSLKELSSLAIARKCHFHWQYVWTLNGRICAHKTEGSASVEINSADSLIRIE